MKPLEYSPFDLYRPRDPRFNYSLASDKYFRRNWPMLPIPIARRMHKVEKHNYRRARCMKRPAIRVDFIEVCWQRDFTCYHCSEQINYLLPFDHDDGLTLEHITPMNIGGSHIAENVTCAHRRCNMQAAYAFRDSPDRYLGQQRRMLERGQLAGLIWPHKHLLKGCGQH